MPQKKYSWPPYAFIHHFQFFLDRVTQISLRFLYHRTSLYSDPHGKTAGKTKEYQAGFSCPVLVREREMDAMLFLQPERQAVASPMCFAFHPIEDGTGVMVERYVFSSLLDFLYVELGKAIEHGNAPRQCCLCGRWFLHEQGDRTMYCERIAPGEGSRTCREAGARMVFKKKIQDEDTWKIYKRAYKKYYARYMKGNMSETDFKTWAARAAAEKDAAIEKVKGALDEDLKAQIVEELREKLNCQ